MPVFSKPDQPLGVVPGLRLQPDVGELFEAILPVWGQLDGCSRLEAASQHHIEVLQEAGLLCQVEEDLYPVASLEGWRDHGLSEVPIPLPAGRAYAKKSGVSQRVQPLQEVRVGQNDVGKLRRLVQEIAERNHEGDLAQDSGHVVRVHGGHHDIAATMNQDL